MTLKEIAAKANVSISTVSRVLNSPDNSFATEDVRNRIWDIAKQTDYTPNISAKRLRMGENGRNEKKTKTIICVFGRTKTPEDNPFYAQIARAIEQQALQLGYVTTSSFSIFNLNDMNVRQKISSSEVDGVVVLGWLSKDLGVFIGKHFKNIVYIGINSVNEEWDQVICDGYQAATTALKYLIRIGHKHIGYIGEIKNEARYTAFKDTLLDAGLEFDHKCVSNCPLNSAGGYAGAQEILNKASKLPTAVFCVNDVTAIGAIKYFNEQGYNVPKHISVVSMDNIDIAQYTTPMLTTINVPKEELGSIAVRVLIDRIEKGHKIPLKIILPSKLIVRDSAMQNAVECEKM